MSKTVEVDTRIEEIKELIKKELNYALNELEMKLYRRFSIKEIEFGINFVKQTTYVIQSISRLMYSAITNRWSYGKKKAKQIIEKAKEVINANKNKQQFNPTQKPKNKFMNFEQTPYDFEKIEQMELERTLKKIKEKEATNKLNC